MLKKYLTTFFMLAMLAVMMPAAAATANAQTRYLYGERRAVTVYRRPNVYQRHKNLFDIAIGSGAGAVIGALIGGKRGAGVGALIGAGGGALYTYKLNPKRPRYYLGR